MQVWTNLCNRNALIRLETILCEIGRICAIGNVFEWLTVGRNSNLNLPAKIRTVMCRVSFVWRQVMTIGGQAPSAHGRGSTFFQPEGGRFFQNRGGPLEKNSLEFLKSAIRAEKLLQK